MKFSSAQAGLRVIRERHQRQHSGTENPPAPTVDTCQRRYATLTVPDLLVFTNKSAVEFNQF
jgi:hypothetical protein